MSRGYSEAPRNGDWPTLRIIIRGLQLLNHQEYSQMSAWRLQTEKWGQGGEARKDQESALLVTTGVKVNRGPVMLESRFFKMALLWDKISISGSKIIIIFN